MMIEPVVLTGEIVRLEPLSRDHVPLLSEAGRDERIWTYMRYGQVTTLEAMQVFVESLLEMQQRGTDLPFTVIHKDTGLPVGMTRYMNIDRNNRALEIGGTWYGLDYQRTGVNTECKYLLLRHAFEVLQVIRVQFKADLRNERSLRAIERIGAVREGVLRNHMILPDGTVRDSVFYSIIPTEWPSVKRRLEALMHHSPAAPEK